MTNYLNSKSSKDTLQQIATVLQNDKDMLRMLFSEQQIMLLASTVENLTTALTQQTLPTGQSYRDDGTSASREMTILDESVITPEMREAVLGFFGSDEYASASSNNKRILTVGIPLGFTQRLKQKVSIRNQKRASFTNKQNDIINVTVYKVDIQNPDIVYKPQRFMFELSRFPVRNSSNAWLPLPFPSLKLDIINAIPTRCFDANPDAGTASSISSGVEYARSFAASVAGHGGNERAPFTSPSYDFLLASEKQQILENHVLSQLLESYIKLMTGINVSEYNYHMTDPAPPVESDFVKSMTEHTIEHVAAHVEAARSIPLHSNGILFSTAIGRSLASIHGSVASRGLSNPILSHPSGIAGQVTPSAMFRSIQQ